ncbi:hypothetical protein [Streptomyces acidicola]|uniref:hypothetical protein n=1 Tax=Streptomyces acidicola TaxID=2596892 RepID=UPI00380B0F6D
MSSHMVAELQGACDYLVLVNNGTVRLAGEIDAIGDAHRLLRAPDADQGRQAPLAGPVVVEKATVGDRLTALVRPQGPLPGEWEIVSPTLEDLLPARLRTADAPALITPSAGVGAPAAREPEVTA